MSRVDRHHASRDRAGRAPSSIPPRSTAPSTTRSCSAAALQAAGAIGVIIATKFGFRIDDGKVTGTDSRPDHIREVVEASLKRLGPTTSICSTSIASTAEVPIEDVVGAMAALVARGQGPLSRPVRSRRGNHPSRARRASRSPRCRASTRCGSAISSRRSSRCCANSASAWCRSARWAAAF